MRTKLNGERLWLTEDGVVVCEYASCTTESLALRLSRAKMSQIPGPDGTRYNVLNEADLREFGTLMQASGTTLHCKCGEVYYNTASHSLHTITTEGKAS